MTKRINPAKHAKALLKALNRDDAQAHALRKLNALRGSANMADMEAAMFWREVLVQLLAY